MIVGISDIHIASADKKLFVRLLPTSVMNIEDGRFRVDEFFKIDLNSIKGHYYRKLVKRYSFARINVVFDINLNKDTGNITIYPGSVKIALGAGKKFNKLFENMQLQGYSLNASKTNASRRINR